MGWSYGGEIENGDGECLKPELASEKVTEIYVVMEASGTRHHSRRRDTPAGGGVERVKSRGR